MNDKQRKEVIGMIDGAKIKQLRGKMTQRKLAAKADITEVALCRIETGKVKAPKMETVEKLAAALDVEPGALMSGEGDLWRNKI